jgi:hypothetical protein
MKQNKKFEDLNNIKLVTQQRIAFHEAGHAAGIHLNNKNRQLPPVFFKIIFKDLNAQAINSTMAYQTQNDDCVARVEGGRLISCLPPSIESLQSELVQNYNSEAMEELIADYMVAFEADIINMLIGPLAEAKYVAETDGEVFNNHLIDLKSLTYYGGDTDLALANKYLKSFSADKKKKQDKLNELYAMAFNFVKNNANWAAISLLAQHILGSRNESIGCEEIISRLDSSIEHSLHQSIKASKHHN